MSLIVFCTSSLFPRLRRMKTPDAAAGMEPMANQRTSSHRTVLRRMCTPLPIGFMIMAATRSLDTAALGLIPNRSTRIGVMSAPPPMPVSPTVNPTSNAASVT